MQQALKLLSTEDAGKAGLGCDPSLLLLLMLDPCVLDEQIPVGRVLLRVLDSLSGCRAALVQEVRDFMLSSDEHWQALAESSASVSSIFHSSKRGRKAEVLNAFEHVVNSSGKHAYYPSLLQIVYPSGSRQHVLMSRQVFDSYCILWTCDSQRVLMRRQVFDSYCILWTCDSQRVLMSRQVFDSYCILWTCDSQRVLMRRQVFDSVFNSLAFGSV